MIKRKVKLEILNDYIKILKFELLLCSKDKFKLQFVKKVKNQYDKIFLKIGMMDNAFYILKNDFQQIDKRFFRITKNEIDRLENEVQHINKNLPIQLNSLGFNELEKNYILNGQF